MAKRSPPAGPPPAVHPLQRLADLYQRKEYASAEAYAHDLLQQRPEHADVLNLLGVVLLAQRRVDEAVAILRRAVTSQPRHPGAHNNLGMALRELGSLEAAVSSFEAAVQVKPDYLVARINLGDSYVALDRPYDAAHQFRAVVEAAPNRVDVRIKLGSALREFGRPDEAATVYGEAIARRPDDWAAHNNLGNVLAELGDKDRAIASYRRAIELEPGQPMPHYNLHALLLDPSDMQPSIACLEAALRCRPDDTMLALFLGVCLDYAGESVAAQPWLEQASRGPASVAARHDAWMYLRAQPGPRPRMTGVPIDAFRLAMAAASQPGLVLEFGVRFGTSIRQLAALAQQPVHGFDSFEGLPDAWGDAAAGLYTTRGVLPQVPDHVELHAGWFEDTLPPFLASHDGPLRLANIDCDIYRSTVTVLEQLAARMQVGTVLVFDEYIGNPTWRDDEFKAFQKAVVEYGWSYEYLAFSLYTKQVVVRLAAVDASSDRASFSASEISSSPP